MGKRRRMERRAIARERRRPSKYNFGGGKLYVCIYGGDFFRRGLDNNANDTILVSASL